MSNIIREIRQVEDAVVVSAEGEITIRESPELHKSLVEVCQHNPRKLIVDLSQVQHIDSSGVGTLVEVFRRVKHGNGKMCLVGMTDMVRGVFEITRLDQFFSVFDTEEEALRL